MATDFFRARSFNAVEDSTLVLKRNTRAQSGIAATTTVALVLFGTSVALLGSGLATPLVAQAAPAPTAAAQSFTATGSIGNVTVPAGVCAVQATVVGGAGASAMDTVSSANGAAASIVATYPVLPGQVLTGTVASGGRTPSADGTTTGAAGAPGGAAGGTSGAVSGTRHPGAGGGGYSELLIAGSRAILAGGGGGTAGGHSTTTLGFGGNAGIPAAAAGTFAGAAGTGGKDTPTATVTGGGGGSTAGGAAGTNSADAAINGLAGGSLAGGRGGNDSNPDAGGGGGGGLFGGGGGASTVGYNTQNGSSEITGGGGGGGSSFVAATSDAGAVSGISGSSVGKITTASRTNGANGSITLNWVMCDYDLAVTKTASSGTAVVGSTITWTVSVENVGTAPMTQGDTVTLADTLPGGGTTSVVSTTVTGGTNTTLARGAVTCNTAVGSAMPGAVTCTRPYQIVGGSVSGVRGIDPGEKITIVYTQTVTAAAGASIANQATITDRKTGDTNDSTTSTVTVVTPPTAVNDTSLNNVLGTTVEVNAPGNDLNAVGSTVTLYNTTTNTPITSPYVVANEGTWTVAADGKISFTPLATFYGDPTPVTYRIANATGQTATATVTITYLPKAVNDSSLNNPVQTTASRNVLTNDQGIWNIPTLRIVSGATEVTSLVIPNQGTWAVSGSKISFTPLGTYFGDPAPIDYVVTDTSGDKVGATLTVTYVPIANNDTSTGNTLHATVTRNVLTNDVGTFDLTTLRIVSGASRVSSLVVPTEGTWTANTDGTITFAPLAGFTGDPTPITYAVRDTTNDEVTATLAVSYLATVTPDTNLGNAAGSTVSTNVVTNDNGNFVANSVRIIFGGSAFTSLTVAGQGVWTVTGDSISFAPEANYFGDPTPITYRVTDATRGNLTSTLTVTYVPRTVNDTNPNNPVTQNATTNVLANDVGTWNTGSLRIRQGGVDFTSLTVAGQGVWTANADGTITFDPDAAFFGDPTPIAYAITDTTGDTVTGTLTVTYLPKAVNDSNLGNALDATVSTNVIANDLGAWAAGSLRIVSGASNVTSLFVPTQGTWNVVGNTTIEFVPITGFLTDPTPITYTNVDTTGDRVVATLTVTYLPQAVNDTNLGNVMHSTVTTSVLGNDKGVFTANTVRIMNGTTPVSSLLVTNQGTWTANADGTITFVPLGTYFGDPTPITYAVTDTTGDTVTATLTVTYLPQAVNDSSDGHAPLSTASLNVLTNDIGAFDPNTLRIVTGATTSSVLNVPAEGLWAVTSSGIILFFPRAGFYGDPTPIDYSVRDITGDVVTATLSFDYVPVAVDDEVFDLAVGSPVNVPVFGNDQLIPDTNTLRIVDGGSLVTSLPVTGGVWSVVGSQIRFTPNLGYEESPAQITYSVTDTSGDTDTATVTVHYAPKAHNDVDLNNTLNQPVTVTVLANDSGATGVTVSLVGANGSGTIVVPTEGTWSVVGSEVVFTPLASFHANPTPIDYRITDTRGNESTASVTVTYLPAAREDLSTGHELDDTVDVSVLANDYGTFNAATLRIVSGATLVSTLTVTGQGVWTVQPNGVIRFDPEPGFVADPTPIRYSVADTAGNLTDATVTIRYLARANNDSDLLNPFGSTVDVTPLANDNGDFTGSTVKIVDGTSLVSSLTVTDQGTWTVEAGNVIRFVPLATFLTDPTPIRYAVEDVTGHEVRADITVTYVPLAVDDADLGNHIGDTVGTNVLLNDKGDFVVSSLRIENGAARVTTLTVPGQGVWTVTGSIIAFDPEDGFLTDPTPIRYEVTDSTGDKVSAEFVVTYVPEAVNDSSLGHAIGDTVTQAVLANDNGSFGTAVPVLVYNNTRVSSYSVTGQGTWSVVGTSVRFTPVGGFYGDPASAVYEITDVTGDTVSASVSVDYLPEAIDNHSAPSTIGTSVVQNVLINDRAIYPATPVLTIVSGASRVSTLVVPNQGTWKVLSGGRIEFVPLASFTSDPTPISYEATDVSGDKAQAKVFVDYTSVAANDSLVAQVLGATVSRNVLTNDTGAFDATTLRIDDNGTPVSTLTVPYQGTWTVLANGVIEFNPIDGFLTDPTPITYTVEDLDGAPVSATFTVEYLPNAKNDSSLANTTGATVDVNVLANDEGDFDASSLVIRDGAALVTSLTVPTEGTWSVLAGGHLEFEPLPTFLGDPTPVVYEITDTTGDTVFATVTVSYSPEAIDDSSTANVIGDTVTTDVLANDIGAFIDTTLAIKDGAARVTSLIVPNEGTWTVLTGGRIQFVPLATFEGDPTPIDYEVTDITGDIVSAELVVDYAPEAKADSSAANPVGDTVTVTVLANDLGVYDDTTLTIKDGALRVTSLVVPNEGTWTVLTGGRIEFVPLATFLGDPTPIAYEVSDVSGDLAGANLTVLYVPEAVNDAKSNNTLFQPATVNALANDLGDFVVSSIRLIDPVTLTTATTVVVSNQGTWTVDTATGDVTFTPLSTFSGNPTPIVYVVTDTTGDTVDATVTISYRPEATNDVSTGNVVGKPVTIDVVGNDVGSLDPTSVRIVTPGTGALVTTLLVPGEGTWSVTTTTGEITFTPLPRFTGDPTALTYQVSDTTGATTTAQISIDYVQLAAGLVITGADVTAPLLAALVAMLLGGFAILFARRRRAQAQR